MFHMAKFLAVALQLFYKVNYKKKISTCKNKSKMHRQAKHVNPTICPIQPIFQSQGQPQQNKTNNTEITSPRTDRIGKNSKLYHRPQTHHKKPQKVCQT